MVSNQDIYKLLGLSRDADQAQIKKAYHAACLENHPDKNKSEGANSTMQAINAAYEILSDPKKKEDYDQAQPTGARKTRPAPKSRPAQAPPRPSQSNRRAEKPLPCLLCGKTHQGECAPTPRCWQCGTYESARPAPAHLHMSCKSCYWCFDCVNKTFEADHHTARPRRMAVPERSAYRSCDIEVSFDEVKHMLRPDIRADCERLRLPACQWCGCHENLLNVCRDHIWCQRCLLQLYASATRDPACCRRMSVFSSIKHYLPGSAIALYEMKVGCNFKFWHQPSIYNKLLQEWINWQNQYPGMAYGTNAAAAMAAKDYKIEELDETLAAFGRMKAQMDRENRLATINGWAKIMQENQDLKEKLGELEKKG
ncbi:hypothetical protein E4T47_05082 [Aureobasidium subglaciale]|nr:hypothetical protein E4T47_05082 [Aureobasidium subglaciale]